MKRIIFKMFTIYSLYDDYYKLIKMHKKISKKVNDVEHEKEYSLVTKMS
jgi:hypothetical protein